MELIKFEEQAKNKLEQRRIHPSSDAWNKLTDRLDANQEKQKNNRLWWQAIAAIFIGAIFSLSFVFTSESNIVAPVIVDVKKQPAIKLEEPILKNNLEEEVLIALEKPVRKEISSPKKAPIRKKIREVISLNETHLNSKILENKIAEKSYEDASFQAQKTNEGIAQLKQPTIEKTAVTNEEITILLEAAKKTIAMQKTMDASIKTVDADALLWSVENNLNPSLKDKVFSAIKSGYESVTVAFIKRKNEQ
jgi:hypothetical protein